MLDVVALDVSKIPELHLSTPWCFHFHRASLKCATRVTFRPSEPCSACFVYSQRRWANLLNPLEVHTLSLKHKRSTESFRYAYTLTTASSFSTVTCTVGSISLWPSRVYFPGDSELSGHRWKQGNLPFSSPSLFTIWHKTWTALSPYKAQPDCRVITLIYEGRSRR